MGFSTCTSSDAVVAIVYAQPSSGCFDQATPLLSVVHVAALCASSAAATHYRGASTPCRWPRAKCHKSCKRAALALGRREQPFSARRYTNRAPARSLPPCTPFVVLSRCQFCQLALPRHLHSNQVSGSFLISPVVPRGAAYFTGTVLCRAVLCTVLVALLDLVRY